MLGMMAQSGAGYDVSGALPLSLPYLSAGPTSPLLHFHHIRHLPHSLLLQQYADSLLHDPVHRLPLSRLPIPDSPKNSRPLKSFCIKDILGQDTSTDRHARPSLPNLLDVSSSSAYRTMAMASTSRPLSCEPFSCRLLSRVRTPSTSPSTPTSTSGCPSPTDLFNMSSAMCGTGVRIVRPWLTDPFSPDIHISSDDGVGDSALDDDEEEEEEEEISVDDDDDPPCGGRSGGGEGKVGSRGVSPLDALMAMTSTTLTGLHTPHSAEARRREQQALLFSKHATPKKRRKSRTAFSNQQICQLEKRFLFQKYLTPADRDNIAHTLGLSNSQVITWFQNRRAKLKRDLEELKNDVTAAKKHSVIKPVTGTKVDRHLHKVHHHVRKPAKDARRVERESGRSGKIPSPPSFSSSSRVVPGSCSPASSSRHSPLDSGSGTLSPPLNGCPNNNSSSKISLVNNNNVSDDHQLHSDDLDSTSSCEELVVIDTEDECGSRQEGCGISSQPDTRDRSSVDTEVSTLTSIGGTV